MMSSIWFLLGVVVISSHVKPLSLIDGDSSSSPTSLDESERLMSNLDDPISHVDYLITIYSSTTKKPCFYFSEDRYSQPESSLINCTWYKLNACCKRTEVASVFLTMFTLNEASQTCMNLMNYMMCFFCSPEQYVWYRNSKVAICLKYCEDIYRECRDAEYGGKRIGHIYKDGKTFCEAQDFKIIDSNSQCFDFDPSSFSRASPIVFALNKSSFVHLIFLLITSFFLYTLI